ncbi:MAG: MFS transporter [Christensenellales bacterium]
MTLLLAVIYITFISLGLPDSLFGAAWPVVHTDFGISEGFGSVYTVIVAVTTGGISFFAGSLIRKFGTGTVTAVSVVLTAVSMLGISFAPNVWVMMAFAIVGGYGAGAIDTGLNNFVSVHYKAIHMNWLHCFWGVGITVSPLIMSYFLRENNWRAGYRTVSYVQFGISLIVLLSLVLWKKYDTSRKNGQPEVGEKKPAIKIIDILKTKGLIYGILSLGTYCAMEQLLITWGASYLVNNSFFSPSKAAGYISAFYGGIMLGRFAAGLLSLKVSDKNLIRGGIVCAVIGIIMLFTKNGVALLVALLLIGFGFGPVFPSVIHAVPARFGVEKSADVTGFHMGGAYAIGFGGQMIFGLVATRTTFAITPWCLIGLCALCFLFSEVTNVKTKKI